MVRNAPAAACPVAVHPNSQKQRQNWQQRNRAGRGRSCPHLPPSHVLHIICSILGLACRVPILWGCDGRQGVKAAVFVRVRPGGRGREQGRWVGSIGEASPLALPSSSRLRDDFSLSTPHQKFQNRQPLPSWELVSLVLAAGLLLLAAQLQLANGFIRLIGTSFAGEGGQFCGSPQGEGARLQSTATAVPSFQLATLCPGRLQWC